ncbi:MAG TPA: DUF4249 domain-containing protein [Cyclobacteriaceae bacterium]|nr:DUF4249 domain-containing protein [Cyclobacteriaceae bacterium]
MKFSRLTKYFSFVLVLIAAGCLDPYTPPDSVLQKEFLVVDGFVNTGSRSAEVKLSRAVPLSSENVHNPVTKATVQLESGDGLIIPLPETLPGVYYAGPINVFNGKTYQLRIFTPGNEYVSDVVEMKKSPVLDSVTWRADDRGITIYVDSHDVTGSTKYYQWNFSETWEYTAQEYSQFIWDKARFEMKRRTFEQDINLCYGSATSTRVLISSTTSNSQDVVSDFNLAFIPKGSPKVTRLYSILVQQRAMDDDAYAFWKALQRTTENVGGLFDALPSEITGNVTNVKNAGEKVLGYFTGGEVQEKRIYIYRDEVPEALRITPKITCNIDSILIPTLADYDKTDLNVIRGWGAPATVGYLTTSAVCVDCRVQGGVLKKPSFWPR